MTAFQTNDLLKLNLMAHSLSSAIGTWESRRQVTATTTLEDFPGRGWLAGRRRPDDDTKATNNSTPGHRSLADAVSSDKRTGGRSRGQTSASIQFLPSKQGQVWGGGPFVQELIENRTLERQNTSHNPRSNPAMSRSERGPARAGDSAPGDMASQAARHVGRRGWAWTRSTRPRQGGSLPSAGWSSRRTGCCRIT